jgi:hypothetical protein
MNKTEAERIAAATNVIRPDWSPKLLMTVLADDRMIRRPYADALLALVACALDDQTKRPGRVHEKGAWWSVVTVVSGQQGPAYREIKPGYCVICGDNWSLHGEWSEAYGGHNYENPITDAKGVAPTAEQRAAIDAANVEARKKVTAEKEAKVAKEVADMDEVLARHASGEMTEEMA